MDLGDVLIAREVTNGDLKSIISSLCSISNLFVINDPNELFNLPEKSEWIALYRSGKGRFPCHISTDSISVNSELRFALAKRLGVEIAWSSENDLNPFKWSVVYPTGLERIEYLNEEDI